MSEYKRSTIHIQAKTIEAFGDRGKSGVVNQTMQRLTAAADTVDITDADRKFYAPHRRKDYSPGYPDQAEILKKFAKQKGCDLSTALVCLEKIERES
jgi:hypothetical protein